MGGATYTATATATSGLRWPSARARRSVCTSAGANGSVCHLRRGGTCIVDANQAGNGNYNAATQVQQTFTVGKDTQTVSFTSTAPAAATVGGATYTPTATATSGLTVTITVDASSSSVCSISGGVVSFTATGTCVLDANQAGNGTYNAAPQVQQTFTVGKGSQTITFTSTSADGGQRRRGHLHRGGHRDLGPDGDVHLGLDRGLHLGGRQRLGLHLRRERHLHR